MNRPTLAPATVTGTAHIATLPARPVARRREWEPPLPDPLFFVPLPHADLHAVLNGPQLKMDVQISLA
jgi:hypothetical protein